MMSDERECSRCGADVTPVLSPPPKGRDVWHRYRVGMRSTTATWKLRFRMFTLRWLPENPRDQLRETYTELDLCDPCARDVLAFAQTRPDAAVSGSCETPGETR